MPPGSSPWARSPTATLAPVRTPGGEQRKHVSLPVTRCCDLKSSTVGCPWLWGAGCAGEGSADVAGPWFGCFACVAEGDLVAVAEGVGDE